MAEWIDVKDQLPELDTPVWISAGELLGIGARADIHDGNWGWAWALSAPSREEYVWEVDGFELDDFEPTHWMPLPEPPK